MRTRLPLPILALVTFLAATCLSTNAAGQSDPLIQDVPVYVKMDFWKPPDQQSAAAWHFDPNNGDQWTQLPNDPLFAIPRVRFEIARLFKEEDLEDAWVWFLGVPSIRVVRGSPSQFEDVSEDSHYTEMIDLVVIGADPTTTGMQARDPCGSRIWPIATGSEMTTYELFEMNVRHCGMRMVQDSGPPGHVKGLLYGAAWRWKNPAGLEEEDVYVELTLRFDLRDSNEFYGYQDTYVSWISAAGGCGYTFCLTPEQSTAAKVGTPYLPTADPRGYKLVLAVPHVLDHTAGLQLFKRRGTQNTLLANTQIENLNSHATGHKCEPDGQQHPSHTHASGAAGHLKKGGLSPRYFVPFEFMEGYANPPDEVVAAAWFDIPAHNMEAPTDHRALYMLFWFITPRQEP